MKENIQTTIKPLHIYNMRAWAQASKLKHSSERFLKIQQVLKTSEHDFQQVHMAKSIQLLNILNNLILSTVEDMVPIGKETLADISINLQQAHETNEFLQLEL